MTATTAMMHVDAGEGGREREGEGDLGGGRARPPG